MTTANTVADVTFVLEGTYPYVRGGVSSWVHQLIRGLPELSFSLLYIGPSREKRGPRAYELPPNVVHLEECFLSKPPASQPPRRGRGDAGFFEASARLHDAFRDGATGALPDLERMFEHLARRPEECREQFLTSERAWHEITSRYEASAPTRPFLEYFWTIRSMHAPLFELANVAARLPPTKLVHVVSTGFAGFLATLLKHQRKVPLLLTEHGIYTKERRIELLLADWIADDDRIAPDTRDPAMGYFRQLWIRFFERLGAMTYHASDRIVALFEENRRRQIADGAPAARTRVVENGIATARLAALRAKRDPSRVPPVMALIGRVVPIKDIKTFIRAAKIVVEAMPEAEAWIVGPEEEDPVYARGCRALVQTLGLGAKVKFLGFRPLDEVLPAVGVNVLTSISEAQPLVILEGFAAGVPCVATDVGACRELIEGRSSDGHEAGGHEEAAGRVVRIASPEATAQAVLGLLRDRQAWQRAEAAGHARVQSLYTEERMLAQYRQLYGESAAPPAATPKEGASWPA